MNTLRFRFDGDSEDTLVCARSESFFRMKMPILPVAYVRTTQRQKFVDPQYAKYHDYKRSLQDRILILLREFDLGEPPFFRPDQRLRLSCYFERDMRPDLNNLVKGLEDAVQGVLYNNDSQIDKYDDCYRTKGEGWLTLAIMAMET